SQVEQKKQHASISETRHSTLEAQLQTEREALERKEKEICNLEEQLEQFREELENKSEEVQQLHMQLEIQRKEISSQQQFVETRDSMLQVMEEKDREIALLNAQISKLQHMETASDNKVTQHAHTKYSQSPVSLTHCSINIHLCVFLGSCFILFCSSLLPCLFYFLHGKLLDTYLRLKQSAAALAETENTESAESELEEALREKTAGVVVLQAEVQALEQSAASRMEELGLRIQELEDLVVEKVSEINRCQALVEQTQSFADDLQKKVSALEESVREKAAEAVVSQATLEAFQQQQRSEGTTQQQEMEKQPAPAVYEFGDFGIPKMDLSSMGHAQQAPRGKVVHLTEKLRDLEVGLSGMQKDQELQKQLLSSSEEEVLEYERRLAVLMDLLSQMKDGADLSQLLQELQEAKREAASAKEELNLSREHQEKLQEDAQAREVSMSELREELEEMRSSVDSTKEELTKYQQQNEKLQEDIQAREVLFSEQRKELQEISSSLDVSKEELSKYQLRNEELCKEVQAQEVSLSKLKEELQEMKRSLDASKEELAKYQQHNEKLLEEQNEKLVEELRIRELSISSLKKELQEAQPAFSASSTSTAQPKRKGGKQQAAKGGAPKEKQSLSRKNSSQKPQSLQSNSSSDHQHEATTDSFTQTEPFQMTDLSQSAAKEQMEEVIGEFEEKIAQMQELHAAEILDMEARHISESENLRRDTQALEDECKGLKAVIDKLYSTEVPPSRQDRPASHKDGYTSDSSSDYSQRTGLDLPSLQQEFRTTPEGARREADDPLPDRIKMLLREVHQEGMQVLSLSELPLSEGEPSSQFNVDGWVKERDALLATVQSLKILISQMQTHTVGADWRAELLDAVRQVFVRERSVLKSALYSQLDLLDTSDAIVHLNQLERRLAEQDAHHREAMGSLHTAERSSLISEIQQLRGQLEMLHQGKPVILMIHLSERLFNSGNLSVKLKLCSFIPAFSHFPLDRLYFFYCLGANPGLSSAADQNTKEQRGAAADGAAEVDRLISEEVKAELSQTKLELETTRKAQHKHLQELDTLRAEVSQRAAEVDALNDELMEEKRRSRDLQWAVEKERCRSGRDEESKREELEDLQLALDEQKAHVDQLTQTLEQERQASSQLSQKAEEDHLSLQRRLQELEVQLETERAKALEMSSALGRERELRTSISSDGGRSSEVGAHEDRREPEREGSLLERLQRELDDKHTQLIICLPQSVSLLAGGSSSSSNNLTERLLRQNAELTGFVSRLTEEKNELRNHTLRLEEELRRYRQAGVGSADNVGAETLLSQEREAWTREKLRLEKALHLSQSQVARLRGEIRSDTLREISGPESDNSALKRMYGKYLRSESFRKALIYQKKYLLLLLGGFQECEEATLSLLSRMGGQPSLSSLESYSQRRRGLTRFRSAVRVSIALSRMRFLVKRWHKATGVTSTVSCSINKNGTGSDVRDSPYLQPGGLDTYRDRGGGVSSSRGRSGRESPRSGFSGSQHRFHMAADHGALTCSHLQSYDPDRALTDYISRLEALQRRLGSVTSDLWYHIKFRF
uniref:A kinase (PRKA) anchor protein 9 n=1 Tax=Cyprinodon variegatus TaxID=28743 RepID=A0A3Q2CLR6_CYPVA